MPDFSGHRQRRAATPQAADFGGEHTYDTAKLIYKATKANHILHYSSIAILAVFVIEVRADNSNLELSSPVNLLLISTWMLTVLRLVGIDYKSKLTQLREASFSLIGSLSI